MSECCKHCGGDGWSDVGRRLKDEWDGQAPFDPVAYGAKPITAVRRGRHALRLARAFMRAWGPRV